MASLIENQSNSENEPHVKAQESWQSASTYFTNSDKGTSNFEDESEGSNFYTRVSKGLSQIQQGIVRAVKAITYQESEGDTANLLAKFQAEMIGQIVPSSSKGSKKEELRVILKSKRGNQTRYIRTLLKSMALALIEMRTDLQDHYILSLPKRIENCQKIK